MFLFVCFPFDHEAKFLSVLAGISGTMLNRHSEIGEHLCKKAFIFKHDVLCRCPLPNTSSIPNLRSFLT